MCVGEGRREADRRLLEPAPPQLLCTAGTLFWHREAEDVIVTVAEADHGTFHLLLHLLSTFPAPPFAAVPSFLAHL